MKSPFFKFVPGLFGGVFLAMAIGAPPAPADTLHVGTGQTYHAIQAAVDAAQTGDLIIVGDGLYEENVHVDKPLTIRSENGSSSTFVGFSGSWDHIISVAAPNVTIEGFSVFGATDGQDGGIYLGGAASGCTIRNNRCGWDAAHKNFHGIKLEYGSGNTIELNTCSANDWDGINLLEANGNTLVANTVSLNYNQGIMATWSDKNTVTGNEASQNGSGGIRFDGDDNIISSNRVTHYNGHGIGLVGSRLIVSGNITNAIDLLMVSEAMICNNTCTSEDYFCGISLIESQRNRVIDNHAGGIVLDRDSDQNVVKGNTSDATCGITIKDSHNNRVMDNTVTRSWGIYLESASNNTVTGNVSFDNDNFDLGLVFSDDNRIYLNRFGRTEETPVASGVSTNRWAAQHMILFDHEDNGLQIEMTGNFYGDHDPADADGDGIADSPYGLPGTEPEDPYPLSRNAAFYTAPVALSQELTVPAGTAWGVYRSLWVLENGELIIDGLLLIGAL